MRKHRPTGLHEGCPTYESALECPHTACYRLVAGQMYRVRMATSVQTTGLWSFMHTLQTAPVRPPPESFYNEASRVTFQVDNHKHLL